jgi:amino-acid N-acetyltransferase
MNTGNIVIRSATTGDMEYVIRLLSTYFLHIDGVAIEDFMVADINGRTVGCAAITYRPYPELHTIAIHKNYRGRKVGSLLVKSIVGNMPEEWDNLYVRTTAPRFFEKAGFMKISDSEKRDIWEDCASCERFDNCKQSAMRLPLKGT